MNLNAIDNIREQILDAKEKRWLKQQKIINKYQTTLISFKFNIPSWPKISSDIETAFHLVFTSFQNLLKSYNINFEVIDQENTIVGPEAFLISKYASEKMKIITIQFEESTSIGRLLDIDVLTPQGIPIERTTKRTCYLCNNIAIDCMRINRHSSIDARIFFDKVINDFLKENI
ncbi:MAG: citrate lyase holo-[acyl-carrier protein] synthase [Candidatus Thorarchaeota archaeon]